MSAQAHELPGRPLPAITPESRPYWDALNEHRLVFQACADCGTVRHYPRPLCAECFSLRVTWVESRGRGTVHSWTVAHHPFHLAFKGLVPYALVTVDMPEGVRVQAPWRGEVATLKLGLPVQVVFERVAPTLTLPAFVAATAG